MSGSGYVRKRQNMTKAKMATKKDAPTLKTPVSLLYDICQKRGATITFPVEQQLHNLFKCVVQVTTACGDFYEGTGLASSKKSAKHAAAKDILLQMEPMCEILLDPEFLQQKSLHNNHDNQNKRGTCETTLLPVAPSGSVQKPHNDMKPLHGENNGMNAETAKKTADSDATVHVTTTQKDQIKITLTLPYLNGQEGFKSLSVFDMIPVIREWRGENISKLKKKSTTEVHELKNPLKAVDVITREQNLNAEYFILEEKSDNDLNLQYTCILEVTSFPLDDPVKQQSHLHFTEFGSGDDQANAQRIAAKKFLLMLRMILNAN